MAVEPRARLDPLDASVLAHDYTPLRQVELERAAPPPGGRQGLICAVERSDHAFQQRTGELVRRAVARRLDLLVSEPRRRAHEAAHEAVAPLAPLSVDPEMDGHAGAVLV